MELSQKGSVPVMDFLFTLLILCDVNLYIIEQKFRH